MPDLVRLYIRNAVYGLGLSVVFVGLLLGFDIAGLRHLILGSDVGYVALALLLVFNTIVFGSVQFGIAIMRMAEDDNTGGGRRDALPIAHPGLQPIPVRCDEQRRTARQRQLHRR